jgi:hypothetical protein
MCSWSTYRCVSTTHHTTLVHRLTHSNIVFEWHTHTCTYIHTCKCAHEARIAAYLPHNAQPLKVRDVPASKVRGVSTMKHVSLRTYHTAHNTRSPTTTQHTTLVHQLTHSHTHAHVCRCTYMYVIDLHRYMIIQHPYERFYPHIRTQIEMIEAREVCHF